MKINKTKAPIAATKVEPVITTTEQAKIEACEYILSAIHVLGKNCKDDVVCSEALANLGVILIDLQ